MANGLSLSVTQISNYIKSIFDAEEMLIGVEVYGEITNLKPSSRAVYFDIKDEESALPCVCFDFNMLNGFKFGDKVSVIGKLNYYAKTGKLSFIVSKIEKFGQGDLFKKYLELKEKFEKEGLFDKSAKKELPKFAKRVGVVTSATGAVICDIVRVARKKNKSTDIVLYPVKVQGVGAEKEIVEGIKVLDDYNVDVIIVARGGGSFEDYAPFNSEIVVRTCYEAKTPIISAIGHENDWSLIDFVADVRASTPSVASEVAFFDEKLLIESMVLKLKNSLDGQLKDYKLAKQKLSNLKDDLYISINEKFEFIEKIIKEKLYTCENINEKKVQQTQNKLEKLSAKLDGLSPLKLLSNGYTITTKDNKSISSENISVDDILETTTIKNKIRSKVIEVKEIKLWTLKKILRS